MGLCNPGSPQCDLPAGPTDWTDPSDSAEAVHPGGAGGSRMVLCRHVELQVDMWAILSLLERATFKQTQFCTWKKPLKG